MGRPLPKPGDLVTFAGRTSPVVGYVIRTEESVVGHAAVVMGLSVTPDSDSGWPQSGMRWRVPTDDLTRLLPEQNAEAAPSESADEAERNKGVAT